MAPQGSLGAAGAAGAGPGVDLLLEVYQRYDLGSCIFWKAFWHQSAGLFFLLGGYFFIARQRCDLGSCIFQTVFWHQSAGVLFFYGSSSTLRFGILHFLKGLLAPVSRGIVFLQEFVNVTIWDPAFS